MRDAFRAEREKQIMASGTYSMSAADWKRELAAKVLEHAREHYEDNAGWDMVVETMDVEQVVEVIGKATSVNGAIQRVAAYAGTWASVRDDVMATAF